MLARTTKISVRLTLVALTAGVGVGVAATDAVAAPSARASVAHASFDKGAVGWHAGTRTTKVTVIKRGAGKAVAISARRIGKAVLVSRVNLVHSSAAGERYTVSANVRSTKATV